jgi:hypothetical protein
MQNRSKVMAMALAAVMSITAARCDSEDDSAKARVNFEMAPVEINTSVAKTIAKRGTLHNTPSSFQIPVYAVTIFQDNGESYDLTNKNGEYIELAQDPGNVEAVLQAQDALIPEGTYTGLSIFVEPPDGSGFEGVRVQSCSEIEAATYCTKSSFDQNAEGTPAETANLDIFVEFKAIFAEPVEIKQGGDNRVSLLYDISNIVSFTTTDGSCEGGPREYNDCVSLNFLSPPTFAFFGERRTPEIYNLTYSDPDPGTFPALGDWASDIDKWYTRIWVFFDDSGNALAMKSIFVSSEASQEPGLSFKFGGDEVIENEGSDTYTLRQGPNFQDLQLEINGFQRGSHSGQISYYEPDFFSGNGGGSEPKTFNYTAVQEQ